MMSTLRLRVLLALVLAVVIFTVSGTAALGYSEQRPWRLKLSSPSVVRCDEKAVIQATVWNYVRAKPVPNQTIQWRLVVKQSAGDRLSSSATNSNRQGVASVKLIFGPKAGERLVRGYMVGFKKLPPIEVRCRGGLG